MATHLLDLQQHSTGEINDLLDMAQFYRDGGTIPDCRGAIVANLFFENSTRTQYSFQTAEEKLNMRVISFVPETSSLQKNESFYDTVKTFDSFGVNALVIRHSENEYYNELVGHVRAAILNGGDGTGSHPTQSLLDLLTIRQEFGGFEGLKAVIAGDIAHSRVAHTNYEIMTRLGMQVVMSGPPEFMEEHYPYEPFDEAITTSDVVMMLRVQRERHPDGAPFDPARYHREYGLSAKRVATMKEGAIIMHPAPVNRGVEVADEVVECRRSRIFKQMENGAFVRMAALVRALES